MFGKVPSGMSDWMQNFPLQVHTTQLLKLCGDISLTTSKDGILLKFRSVNCLSISGTLKQQSKVSVPCLSQEYLLQKFSVNYYQRIWISRQKLYLVKFHAFSILFFETHLILDIQATLTH